MELKAKQDYLFREIIEANYDPEAFQDYIEQYRGAHLEQYTLEELKSIVQKFKGNQKQDSQVKQIESQISSALPPSNNAQEHGLGLQNTENQHQMIQLAKNKNSKHGSFNTSTKNYHQLIKKQVNSTLFKMAAQNHQSLRIKIRSYSKQVGESLLSRTYIMYLIQTSVGWTVKRRFKDFLWLHTKLSTMYPGFPIPPIPKKTAIPSLEDKHLQQRMVIFQRFANRLLNIPEICSEQIFEEFLSVSNNEQFEACKERFELRLRANKNKIISLKGEKLINMSVYGVEEKQTKFQEKSYQIIRNLQQQLSSFQIEVKRLSEKAFQLSSSFSQAYRHFESKKTSKCEIIELMGDFVSELGFRLDREYYFVKDHLQEYWFYQQKYQQNLTHQIRKVNREQEEILSKSKNSSVAEEEVDIEQAYSHNKSIEHYLSSKELYRIKLSFLIDQLERHKLYDFEIVAKEWAEALQNYVGEIKNSILNGADQLTKCFCIIEGKKLMEVEYISSKKNFRA